MDANLDFLKKGSGTAEKRCSEAFSALSHNKVSVDTVIVWLTQTLWKEEDFSMTKYGWDLFGTIVNNGGFRSERYTCDLRAQHLATIKDPEVRNIAFRGMSLLVDKYPSCWRPSFQDLVLGLKECLNREIDVDEVHFLLKLLLKHHELIASTDAVFKLVMTNVFELLLKHSNLEGLDKTLAFEFLAASVCVPCFVQKAVNELGKIPMSVIEILNKEPMAIEFAPYFIKSFFKQVKLLNSRVSLFFPLGLIEASSSLDVAIPVLRVCREERIYLVEKEGQDFERLKKLTKRAIREKSTGVLIELCRIDFRVVRPHLSEIMPDEAITTEELALEILNEANLQRNIPIIFECGEFPRHILAKPLFIQQYCECIRYMVANRLTLLLDYLVGFNRVEESVLLFWTLQSGRLTAEHQSVIDLLVSNCTQNPWRYTAAVIGAKKLRRQIPPPMPFVIEPETDAVVLHCFEHENYGSLSLGNWPGRAREIPKVPYPGMPDNQVYRVGFIIQQLPQIVQSIERDNLVWILNYILRKAIYAQSITNPQTVADYCLAVLHNSYFYESPEIREVFPEASAPILPKRHFRSDQQISPKMQLRCLLVASMPPEFLDPSVAISAFLGLFLASEGQPQCTLMMENPVDLFKDVSIVDAMCNVIAVAPVSSLSHNIDRIFVNCPDDAIERLLPLIFERTHKLPTVPVNEKPAQLIAICDYCCQAREPLPFPDLLFVDNLVAFCAQLKTGSQQAIEFLLQAEIGPDDVPLIIDALTKMNKENIEAINEDFLGKLVDLVVRSQTISDQAIAAFSEHLPTKLVAHFLEIAPVTFTPSILRRLKLNQDQFKAVEGHILKLIQSIPPAYVLKTICQLNYARFYSSNIVEGLIFVLTHRSMKTVTLDDICELCSCLTQLLRSCRKQVNEIPSLILELARRLSAQFTKRVSKEKPTFPHLRAMTKMYDAIGKTGTGDIIHYLVASFVSHVAQVQLDEIKMRLLQSAIFPLFDRCSKKQLTEVSISLHDSHRQIFRQLHERWTTEAQFRGKV